MSRRYSLQVLDAIEWRYLTLSINCGAELLELCSTDTPL